MPNTSYKSPHLTCPWTAHIAETQTVALTEANGRIAASTIRQYPPGIPDVVPGMRYTDETIEALQSALAAGQNVIGMRQTEKQLVDVAVERSTNNSRPYTIHSFSSIDIPDAVAIEIADFFREQFSQAPYYHFAFHESDPLQSLPQNLDYAAYSVSVALPDTAARLACQEALRDYAMRQTLPPNLEPNPDNFVLPKGFHLWTDKTTCREITKDRLKDAGYVTLVRDKASNRLKGLIHARMGRVNRLFESEEWSNPHLFSAYNAPNLLADPKAFFDKIEYHFGLKPMDPVMTISAQVLEPDIQGGDVFYEMMAATAKLVTPEHTQLPLLCEIPPYGTAHTLNRAFTDRIIFGVLENEHPLIFCKQTSQALFPFISDKSHWHSALRNAARDKIRYRTKYYVPLPTDNASVEVKPNGKLGLAVFATQPISVGTTIAIFTGERYRSETALGLPAIMRDHAIQVGPEEYIFGYKGLAHRICHSCDPNCGIRNLTDVFTTRDIQAGEQITWDYRCSENSNWVLDICLCGSERCTGSVKNYDSLSKSTKKEYLEKNMVSEWLSGRAPSSLGGF